MCLSLPSAGCFPEGWFGIFPQRRGMGIRVFGSIVLCWFGSGMSYKFDGVASAMSCLINLNMTEPTALMIL